MEVMYNFVAMTFLNIRVHGPFLHHHGWLSPPSITAAAGINYYVGIREREGARMRQVIPRARVGSAESSRAVVIG